MNSTSLTSLLSRAILGLLLAVLAPAAAWADSSSPMFAGQTIDIHGSLYEWSSASEDGTWHWDTYTGSGGSVTVTGMIGFPDLAEASGAFSGYLSQGSYGDSYQEWSETGSWEFNGVSYDQMSGSSTY